MDPPNKGQKKSQSVILAISLTEERRLSDTFKIKPPKLSFFLNLWVSLELTPRLLITLSNNRIVLCKLTTHLSKKGIPWRAKEPTTMHNQSVHDNACVLAAFEVIQATLNQTIPHFGEFDFCNIQYVYSNAGFFYRERICSNCILCVRGNKRFVLFSFVPCCHNISTKSY